jgi:glycosidase
MQWVNDAGGGFTGSQVEPWLPLGDLSRNVESQQRDAHSTLNLCRDLIALRKRTPDLFAGAYTPLPSPEGTWTWRRGDSTVIALNLSPARALVRGVAGRVLISTDRNCDNMPVNASLELQPWQGAVVGS